MDPDSIITVIFMLTCVVLSAFFSATETAFTSLNRIRIKNMADSGNKRAGVVLEMYENYDNLLSTILVGNNIVNIALATVATLFFVKHIGNVGATVSTIVVTVVVLIFGEISPKSLAKESPEKFAMFSVPFIRFLGIIFLPINFLFSLWKKLLHICFHVSSKSGMTEDELLTIVDEAQNDGGIDENEGELIRSVIEFNDLCAEDILTPRVDVTAIDISEKNGEIAKIFEETGHSRIPIYDGSIDNIIGILHLKDFHNYVYHHDKTVEQVMQEPLFITGSMPISDLLSKLQAQKAHLAVVADEYGGTEGIVTMEDILEELVGEIWDEHDNVTSDIEKTGEDCYKVNCSTELEEFADFFNISTDSESVTVGGWVMENLGKVAVVGDMFELDKMQVLVTRTDERRVTEIIVKLKKDEE